MIEHFIPLLVPYIPSINLLVLGLVFVKVSSLLRKRLKPNFTQTDVDRRGEG